MKTWILALVVSGLTQGIIAQNRDEDQKKLWLYRVKEVMLEYQNYSQFTSNGININEEYIKQFSTLFDLQGRIYNDLSTKEGSFSDVNEYISFMQLNYPEGLDVSVDLDKIAIVDVRTKKNITYITIQATKHITGLNKNGIHRFDDDLYFVLTPYKDFQQVKESFKITEILSKFQYQRSLADRQQKGIYIGLVGSYASTRIYSDNLYSSNIWSAKAGSSIHPELKVSYLFSRNFGFSTGFRYSRFTTSFSISDFSETSSASMIDIDGELYQPVLNIDKLTEVNSYRCLDFPLLVNLRSGLGKLRLYFDFGVVFSIFSDGYLTLNGQLVKAGYYPQYGMTFENIPEYGFGPINYSSSKKYSLKMPSYNLSGFASAGVIFGLKSNISLQLGVSRIQGLTDLDYTNSNAQNYLNVTMNEPMTKTILQSTNFQFGLIYQLFSTR